MLDFFNKFIKPKNDELAKQLGIKTIHVDQESYTHAITVYTTVGNKRMKMSEKQFYRALGLNV